MALMGGFWFGPWFKPESTNTAGLSPAWIGFKKRYRGDSEQTNCPWSYSVNVRIDAKFTGESMAAK